MGKGTLYGFSERRVRRLNFPAKLESQAGVYARGPAKPYGAWAGGALGSIPKGVPSDSAPPRSCSSKGFA